MTSTAILAHYDPDGQAAGYVLRLLDQLGSCFDDVVVATTAALTEEARSALGARSRLIERENLGQDFGGWREVLRDHVDVSRTDRLLLTNDTFVGMLRPLDTLIADMSARPVEFWGITENQQIARHVQSFFVMVSEPVLRSRVWDGFWGGFAAQADRSKVIRNHEVGLSQNLLAAGFDAAAYYQPTAAEAALAERREAWRRSRMQQLDPTGERAATTHPNHTYALADAALRDGRLPLVKIEALRYDPCFLGEGVLLDLCERHRPDAFEGVRDYLERTATAYPPRPGENPGGAPAPTGDVADLAYRADL